MALFWNISFASLRDFLVAEFTCLAGKYRSVKKVKQFISLFFHSLFRKKKEKPLISSTMDRPASIHRSYFTALSHLKSFNYHINQLFHHQIIKSSNQIKSFTNFQIVTSSNCYIVTSVLSTFALSHTFAQNITTDLQKMNTTLSSSQNLKMVVDYSAGEIKDGKMIVSEANEGYYYKKGDNIRTKVNNTETIINSQYTLTVDDDSKMMIIMKTLSPGAFTMPMDPEKALALASGTNYEKKDGKLIYQLLFDNAQLGISEMKVSIDKQTYFPKELLLVLLEEDTKHYLQLVYKDVNTQATFSEQDFKVTPFVRSKNDTWVVTDRYKNYKLSVQATL